MPKPRMCQFSDFSLMSFSYLILDKYSMPECDSNSKSVLE